MLRLTQVLRCGATVSAVLGVSLLANRCLAQKSPPGGGDWGIAPAYLAADRIEFRLDQKYDQSLAKVWIIGYVKNVKGGKFQGAATARLYEVTGGQSKLVAQMKVPPLASGQETFLAYNRKWGTTWVGLPDQYKLVVQADPDSLGDNPANNVNARSAAEINALFQGVLKTKTPLPPGPTGPVKKNPGPFQKK